MHSCKPDSQAYSGEDFSLCGIDYYVKNEKKIYPKAHRSHPEALPWAEDAISSS